MSNEEIVAEIYAYIEENQKLHFSDGLKNWETSEIMLKNNIFIQKQCFYSFF